MNQKVSTWLFLAFFLNFSHTICPSHTFALSVVLASCSSHFSFTSFTLSLKPNEKFEQTLLKIDAVIGPLQYRV